MADWCFPFKTPPELHWSGGSRFFGSSRGKRKHGGCDVIKPAYEQIYAVADGVLVHEEKHFYLGTYYVTYQHGSILVRYGEIDVKSSTRTKAGQTIKKGEPLAKVGLMFVNKKMKVRHDPKGPKGHMLHIEIYTKGNDHSGLWSDYGPYNRRKDVTDPAPYLDEWVKNLP